MEDERIEEQEQKDPDQNTSLSALAAEVKRLRETTVPREKFDQVAADNARLTEIILSGDDKEDPSGSPEKPDIKELQKRLYGPDCENMNDLQVVALTLQLHDAVIDQRGEDWALPMGVKFRPTKEDYIEKEETVKSLRHCVEVAGGYDGDNEVFVREVTRIMQPTVHDMQFNQRKRR